MHWHRLQRARGRRWGVWFAGIMSPAKPCEPSLVRDGLAVYRIGRGEPVLVMPGPHRFERPGFEPPTPRSPAHADL